jgi:hypothetical protein
LTPEHGVPRAAGERGVRRRSSSRLWYSRLAEVSMSDENFSRKRFRTEDILLPRVEWELRKHWAAELLAAFCIERQPIGAEALQEEMSREAGLELNEISRDLVLARDE